MKRFLTLLSFGLAFALSVPAQGLDPGKILKPPTDTWPTFNGDYTGRRFSPLTEINKDNVASMTLAWAFQAHSQGLQSMPLEVNGVLYISGGNQIWAVDARTGRQIWHFQRPGGPAGGGNKGVAMWKDRLFMTTFDAQLVCVDARNGKLLWQIQIDDPALKAFGTMAPLVIRDHIIVGTSGDTADLPGFLQSIDPITGKVEWRWDSMPKPDDPAWKTWPHDTDVVTRGGGMTWLTGTYDPELNLLYWGTGNPHPVENGDTRTGADLYTCTIVALNPDTGKLVWYFQSSPHDTHDWDMVMTPVLFDGSFNGKPRKMLAQAGKNGLFFVLDRTNGKSLISEAFVHANWVQGYDDRGQPIPRRDKEPQPDGVLVSGGVGTNWQAPSFAPDTGLFYVNSREAMGVFYLTMPGKSAEGWAGRDFFLSSKSMLKAIDYQTGKVRWTYETSGRGGTFGILTTAGRLLFTADNSQNLIALDSLTGKPLWHLYAGGPLSTAPMTYELDGRQYVVYPVDGVVYAFSLPAR
ncbi:MAG TPA: acido-empty-quinoprotein group A [Candidatus Acidoferrales bacterium]|nr:acido-empty-quinoprotein group A [Candidatus Acidoferrales bacterium]